MKNPKFLPVVFQPESGVITNMEYLHEIADLLFLCRSKLFDDFAGWHSANRVAQTLELISRYSNAFWVVIDPKTLALAGVVYLYDWRGGNNFHFSVCASTCFKRQYRGPFARRAAKLFIRYVFRKFRLVSLRAEVFAGNWPAIRFLQSVGFVVCGVNRFQTMLNGRIADTISLARGCAAKPVEPVGCKNCTAITSAPFVVVN